jgi:hypothetical protein
MWVGVRERRSNPWMQFGCCQCCYCCCCACVCTDCPSSVMWVKGQTLTRLVRDLAGPCCLGAHVGVRDDELGALPLSSCRLVCWWKGTGGGGESTRYQKQRRLLRCLRASTKTTAVGQASTHARTHAQSRPWHSTAQHSTAQHSTAQHSTAQCSVASLGPTHGRSRSRKTHHLVAGERALAEVEEEAHEDGQGHLPQERAEEEDGAPDQPVDGQAWGLGGVYVCECVCVCERTTERERRKEEVDPGASRS